MQDSTPRGNRQTHDNPNYSGVEELWATEKFLPGYNRSVVRLLSRHCKPQGSVLEFGAGLGTLARLWAEAQGTPPECLEIDASLREILAQRGFICHARPEEIGKTYDHIYSSNVLEHIGDDEAALRQIHALLAPGGTLALYVPAFMCLYSGLDEAVGHFRRYGRRELTEKLQHAGFEVMESRFVDSAGFFAALAVKWLGYKQGSPLGGERSLAVYDRFIYPVSRALDALGLHYLFGKNLLVAARKS